MQETTEEKNIRDTLHYWQVKNKQTGKTINVWAMSGIEAIWLTGWRSTEAEARLFTKKVNT